jgi:orotidine 5'-phosphate decarboxylase subfamily 2
MAGWRRSGSAAWPADALTINPYLGTDSLQPFVDLAHRRGAGLYVLVRTSNPGAAEFQDRISDKLPLFEVVAQTVQQLSEKTRTTNSTFGCVGAVVGATWPSQLQHLRKEMPSVPLLIPGYGAQGGTSSDAASAFQSKVTLHLGDLRIVKTMHQRKSMMYELSNGFAILPGGIGTLDEFFEILTWARLKFHSKPIGILNTALYYNKLLHFLHHIADEGF